jgi:hypothetical protein
MSRKIFFAAAMGIALSSSHADAAQMGSGFKIGNWAGAAYSSNETKRFSHCAAHATYKHGVALFFMVNRDYQWAVAFSSPAFSMPKGQTIKVRIALDESDADLVDAYVIDHTFMRVNLVANGELFKRFMRGNILRLFGSDQQYSFALQDTAKLLPQLLNCVKGRMNPAPLQAQSAPLKQPDAVPAGKPDLRAEVTSLAANLLSEAGVKGFRIDTPSASDGGNKTDVTWTAPGITGGLVVLLDPAIKRPSDATPRLISVAAEKCKGKFASGAMPEENGAARVFSSCQIGDGDPVMGFYLTISRSAGGHYVIMTFPKTGNLTQTPAPEPDKDIRAAAYRVLQ